MTDDLVSWLHAQVDEDERVALRTGAGSLALIRHRSGRPKWSDLAEVDPLHLIPDEWPVRRLAEFADVDSPIFQHIARWDPPRVLVDVAAKRAVLELGDDRAARALALGYVDRPGYRPEWAPLAA